MSTNSLQFIKITFLPQIIFLLIEMDKHPYSCAVLFQGKGQQGTGSWGVSQCPKAHFLHLGEVTAAGAMQGAETNPQQSHGLF